MFLALNGNVLKIARLEHGIYQTGWPEVREDVTVSIPGVLPPVPEKGELLVDGGVLNNLPIDIMREFNPSGLLLAFDVSPQGGPPAEDSYGYSISGWQQLMRRILPWLKPIRAPKLGNAIMQSMMLGSDLLREQVLNQGLADFYQNIDVSNVGMFEFDALEKAERTGYDCTLKPLKRWAASHHQ